MSYFEEELLGQGGGSRVLRMFWRNGTWYKCPRVELFSCLNVYLVRFLGRCCQISRLGTISWSGGDLSYFERNYQHLGKGLFKEEDGALGMGYLVILKVELCWKRGTQFLGSHLCVTV